ncbi:OsmC family peroxiredoxin [bacterium]|nr:OsmC family peroxiredoxin [bacterium]
MIKRTAKAIWTGTGKEGKGKLSTASGSLNEHSYSFHTRFEDGQGTNPEELIAAAHAGCFAMKLSFLLNENEFESNHIEVGATVAMKEGQLESSDLEIHAFIEGIEHKKFEELCNDALENCPISKALNLKKTMSISLNEARRASE